MSKRIKGITIELDGETRGLDKALSDVNKKSNSVAKELRDVERLLKFNPGNTELVAQKQKLLGDQVETTKDKLNRLKDAEAEVQRQFENGEIGEEQYRAFQREITETESKLSHFENQLEQSQTKLERFGEKMGDAGDKLKNAGEGMKKTGKTMSTHVTAPLAGMAAIMLKTGMDFESSMSNVQAISGATGDDLQALEDKARELGSSTSKSASEAADALGYMALAGWDTTQMMDGLEPVLRLSEAGGIDLARASDLVTDSMSALGLEVSDLPGYLDKVAKASQKSNTDIDALMEAYLVAGGTFDRFNVSTEESAALLGVLANRGTKAGEAGTAVNAIMDNLTSGTGAAAKALEEMGISAFDSEGEFRGMEDVLYDVKDALDGADEETRAQYMSMIAGKNHGKSFQKILSGLGDEYQDLKGDISESDDALNDMADTMQDNAKGKIEQLKSAFEELSIQFSDIVLPAVTSLIEKVTDLINWFGDLDESTQKVIITIGAIAAAIGPILIIVGQMAIGIGGLMSLFSKLVPVISGAIAVIGSISAPVWIAIAAIGALVAIGVALYKNWDTIKEKAVEVWEAITEFLSETWESIKETMLAVWEPIAEFFTELWEQITEVFNTALELLSEKLNEYWEVMGEGITEMWEGIVLFFENIWEIIKNIFVGAFLAIMLLVTGQWEELKEATTEIWNNITEAFENIWEGITQIFSGALSAIFGIVGQVWEDIKSVFGAALEWIDTKTGGKFSEVLETVKQAMDNIWNIIKAVWDYIKNTFTNVLDFLKSLVKGDFQGMKDAINNQMENAKQLLETIWNNIKSFFQTILGDIWSSITDKFQEMKESISDKMNDALDTIKDIWGNVMDFFDGIDLFEIGKNIIQGLIDGIKDMATDVVDSVKGVVDDAIEGAKNLLGIASPSKVFKAIGVHTGEGLELGIRSMGNRVEKAGKAMAQASVPNVPDVNTGEVNAGNVNHGSGSFVNDSTSSMSDILTALMKLAERDVVIKIDEREIIRATAPGMSKELDNMNKMGARKNGVVY